MMSRFSFFVFFDFKRIVIVKVRTLCKRIGENLRCGKDQRSIVQRSISLSHPHGNLSSWHIPMDHNVVERERESLSISRTLSSPLPSGEMRE